METAYPERKVEFLSEGLDTTGDGNIQWIGFTATSVTGEEKNFLWWTNFADSFERVKKLCGALLLQKNVEAQIGPGLDLHASLADKPNIYLIDKTDEDKAVFGVYIEESHRPMFNFFMSMEGLDLPEDF